MHVTWTTTSTTNSDAPGTGVEGAGVVSGKRDVTDVTSDDMSVVVDVEEGDRVGRGVGNIPSCGSRLMRRHLRYRSPRCRTSIVWVVDSVRFTFGESVSRT